MGKYNFMEVQDVICYRFKKPQLLVMALTHDSFCNEHALPSYERLEFLGDSVLGMIVACYLYDKYPDENEGFLTKAKAKIVSSQSLSAAIGKMCLMPYIRVGNSGNEYDIRNSPKVREDIFEAIVGAIFLDGGMKEAKKFILFALDDALNEELTYDKLTDFKSKLLERCAKDGKKAIFESFDSVLDGNVKGFESRVVIEGAVMGIGYGITKKKASQKASERALKTILQNATK